LKKKPGLRAGLFAAGWVAGAGIEWMFANNWMVRAEYLHVDLGTATGTVFLSALNCSAGGLAACRIRVT